MKLQKAEALENRYNESQNHSKRLMKEIEALKKQKKLSTRSSKMLQQDYAKVKQKLDGLWAGKEAEVEHTRLMTKYEMDKVNQIEITKLVDQVSILEE